jgi:ribosomal protein L37AE/L43A
MKKPKRVTTWRTCPNCGSKATKILSANTGMFTCQICDHTYDAPTTKPRKRKRPVDNSWRYRDPPW